MKLKIKNIQSNPFKKYINNGKLDEENVQKIISNLDELGLMGSLPVYEKNHKYYLINGHHRLEALKREFGENYQIEVTLHNYNEEQVLRGMIIENLTQRKNEFMEEIENYVLIRDHLRKKGCSPGEQHHQGKRTDLPYESGTVRDIANWLDKGTGDVVSIGKLSTYLKIWDKLDPELKQKIKKVPGNIAPQNIVTVKQATVLSDFNDYYEQQDLLKAMKHMKRGRPHEFITAYKNASEEIKEQVRKGEIDLYDIDDLTKIHETKEEGEKRIPFEFIPNFSEQMRRFDMDVLKLEKQVAFFREVFNSSKFKEKYNTLKPNQKQRLNIVIFDIEKRIKKCYDEIEIFIEKLPHTKIMIEGGEQDTR